MNWKIKHDDDCQVTVDRAGLLAELAADPKNPYLLGALPEYDNGGDQEVELCTCGIWAWELVATEAGGTVYLNGTVIGWIRQSDSLDPDSPGWDAPPSPEACWVIPRTVDPQDAVPSPFVNRYFETPREAAHELAAWVAR